MQKIVSLYREKICWIWTFTVVNNPAIETSFKHFHSTNCKLQTRKRIFFWCMNVMLKLAAGKERWKIMLKRETEIFANKKWNLSIFATAFRKVSYTQYTVSSTLIIHSCTHFHIANLQKREEICLIKIVVFWLFVLIMVCEWISFVEHWNAFNRKILMNLKKNSTHFTAEMSRTDVMILMCVKPAKMNKKNMKSGACWFYNDVYVCQISSNHINNPKTLNFFPLKTQTHHD